MESVKKTVAPLVCLVHNAATGTGQARFHYWNGSVVEPISAELGFQELNGPKLAKGDTAVGIAIRAAVA